MSDGITDSYSRVSDERYWLNKAQEQAQEILKLQRKIKRLEAKNKKRKK